MPHRIADDGPTFDDSAFKVPWWLHFLGGFVNRHPRLWRRLADIETRAVEKHLCDRPLEAPIYICGLPRSGSTLLHQVVASHPSVGSHRMKDYPFLFTPYWWRRAAARLPAGAPRERAHGDGVMVNGESPEALEEMLWMAFFPDCHNPDVTNVIGPEAAHPDFERFYEAHLRKLLLVPGATRYASKANYHVARLPYLVRLFPDAKVLLPVRSPAAQVASLLRQQDRFSRGQRANRRSLAFMQRSGHFEFGLDRRPMNLGDTERVRQILSDWSAGNEVRGFAAYWDMVYSYLDVLLQTDERVRAATLTVRYETLCASPIETLKSIFQHCALHDHDGLIARHAPTIRKPGDPTRLSAEDRRTIEEYTKATAEWWFDAGSHPSCGLLI